MARPIKRPTLEQYDEIAEYVRKQNKKVFAWQHWITVGDVAKHFGFSIKAIVDLVDDREDLSLVVGFRDGTIGVAEISLESDYRIEYIENDDYEFDTD